MQPEDPRRQIENLVARLRAEADQGDEGNRRWMQKLPELSRHAEEVVAPLTAVGNPLIFVEVWGKELWVRFGDRTLRVRQLGGTAYEASAAIGAAACFVLRNDGHVHGSRRPFFLEGTAKPPLEDFIDLGVPDAVGRDAFGRAVADFLVWALTGPGRLHQA
jgi:hypothetical protein